MRRPQSHPATHQVYGLEYLEEAQQDCREIHGPNESPPREKFKGVRREKKVG